MAPEAERRAAPSSASAPDGEPPKPDAAPNLFAPVSTANRITGQPHGRRQHAQQQLTPGSAYDYGRSEYFQPVWTDPLPRAEDALGYQKSVPATFLKRTLTEPDPAAAEAPGWFQPQMAAYPGIPLPSRQPAQPAPNPATPGAGFVVWTSTPVAPAPPVQPAPPAPSVPPGPTLPEGLVFSTDVARPAALDFSAPEAPASWPLTPPATAAPAGFGMPAPAAFAPAPHIVYAAPPQAYGAYAVPEPPAPPPAPATTPEGVWPAALELHPGDAYGLYPPPMPAAPPLAAEAAPARHRRAERNRARDAYPNAPVADTWAEMGWKAPEAAPLDTTMVWHAGELTMFERDAFAEPLTPFSDARAFAQAGYPPAEPEPAPYPGWGPTSPWEGGEAPAPPEEPAAYPEVEGAAVTGGAAAPYAYGAPYGLPAEPIASPRTKAYASLTHVRTAVGPWRMALWVGCALVLLFCGIEVFKIVQSLVSNEQSLTNYRQEYYRLTGQDPADAANSVELLPAGQTYTPTATPQPVVTATPEPRIAQNDPLIGVVDGGGASVAPALPSQTPATRTRLTKYPDNPLLSADEAYTTLRTENPDVVGHLIIDGLLDEIVVQRNNTFYLTHNARGLHGTQGAVFVDEGCSLKKPPENLLLRAQTQPEGKLFAPLTRYGQEGADFIRRHGIVRCDTIYEKGVFVVFAVVQADSDVNSPAYFNYAGYPTFQSDSQMLGYVKAARSHSVCAIDVGVRADDRLLTLATVGEGNETKNWVIFCRRLREGESETHIQRD